ncbi:MAG: hypothetical protein QNK11_01610 [Legionella sp.]|nr:hypothetical protein [Legionella sp.]
MPSPTISPAIPNTDDTADSASNTLKKSISWVTVNTEASEPSEAEKAALKIVALEAQILALEAQLQNIDTRMQSLQAEMQEKDSINETLKAQNISLLNRVNPPKQATTQPSFLNQFLFSPINNTKNNTKKNNNKSADDANHSFNPSCGQPPVK